MTSRSTRVRHSNSFTKKLLQMQQQQQQLTDAHAVADALKLHQQLSDAHALVDSAQADARKPQKQLGKFFHGC